MNAINEALVKEIWAIINYTPSLAVTERTLAILTRHLGGYVEAAEKLNDLRWEWVSAPPSVPVFEGDIVDNIEHNKRAVDNFKEYMHRAFDIARELYGRNKTAEGFARNAKNKEEEK